MTSKRKKRYLDAGFQLIDGMGIDDFGSGAFPQTAAILGANGNDYRLFDFANFERMWQESTGQTPVSANGNSSGLIVGREKQKQLSFAQVMAGQPELIPNGTFSQGIAGWEAINAGSSVAAESGALRITSPADGSYGGSRVVPVIVPVVGKTYRLEYEILSINNSVRVDFGGVIGPVHSSLGKKSHIVVAVNPFSIEIVRASGTQVNVLIDNVSIKEVPAGYASQATVGMRPTIQPFYSELIGAPELRGMGATSSVGSATPATYNTSTGQGTATRVDVANKTQVIFQPVSSQKTYQVDVENTGASAVTVRDAMTGAIIGIINAGARQTTFVKPFVDTISIEASVNGSTSSFTVHSLKEALTSSGAKFDGSDDNLLSDWFAQAGANCIIAQVTVPATLATTQVFAGSSGSAGTNRIWMAITTGGNIQSSVFGGVDTTIPTDYRGQSIVVAVSLTGTQVQVFAENAASTVNNYTDDTDERPFAIGARNANGSPNSFFGGSIKRIAFGKVPLTLAQFQQIREEWLKAA